LGSFDLAVIGNGIIGSLAALTLAEKNPDEKIALFGPSDRNISASTAAGAMLNVYGEIDYDYGDKAYINEKIDMGNRAVLKWEQFIKKNKLDSIVCAEDTIIFKPKNTTVLEDMCFDAIFKKTSNDLKLCDPKELLAVANYFTKMGYDYDFFGIKGEKAIDIKRFFIWIDKKISKTNNLNVFNFGSCYLDKNNKSSEKFIVTPDNQKYRSKRFLVCSGTSNDFVLKKIGGCLQSFHGVGTALVVNNDQDFFENVPEGYVFRTPNRGGTCGLHVVPRNKSKNSSYYIGAGSNISIDWPSGPRFGTIEYLINSFLKSLKSIDGSLSKSQINIIMGSRPVSLDGKPIIGPLNDHPDTFVLGGTKRDGLTLVFELLAEVDNWLNDKALYYSKFAPNRSPISFHNPDFAKEVYIQNKLTGLLEHNTTNGKTEENLILDLAAEAELFYSKIYKIWPELKDKGIHPELLNVIHNV
jgi:glycine oxidase